MAKKAKTKKSSATKAPKKTKRARAVSPVKKGTAKVAKKEVADKATVKKAKRTSAATESNAAKPRSLRGSGSKAKKVTSRGAASNEAGGNNKAPAATGEDPIQFANEVRRLPKTYLTAKELREFKELLLIKRAELCGDVTNLTNEALKKREGGFGDRSTMPIHMADLGSDNWEQEFTLGLIANEQAVVREIDAALERIENKTYGICVATHKQISKARLRAKLWAKYCIDYARAREEGRAI